MNNQPQPSLKVVAQSTEDPTHFTSSMPIKDLLSTLTSNLAVREIFAQVLTDSGVFLQPVGHLAVTFVPHQQAQAQGPQPEPSSISEEGAPSPLALSELKEEQEPEGEPKPKASSFWGLAKN